MSSYRWAVLFSAFYAFTVFAFGMQLVPPLIGAITSEFSISYSEAGLLMSMVVIPGIFISLPAGIIADRYGMKRIGSVSSILVALGCLVSSTANSFQMLLLGRVILGVGGAFVTTAMPTIIPQWFSRDEVGRAMGIYGINMPLASVVAFPLASSLVSSMGWRYPFYIASALAAINIILLFVIIKEGPLKHESKRDPNIGPAMRNIEIWKVGIVWLFFNAAAISFTTWSPKLFHDFKAIDPLRASFLASVLMWTAIPLAPLFGWISDKIGRRKPFMIIGSILLSGTLIAVSYASGYLMIALLVALGVAAASIPPIVMVLSTEILGPQLAGTGMGITTICLNAGIALAPPLIGFLIDQTNSQTLSFFGMASFSALGSITAFLLNTE
jgi:NNP family nitrate/nitrite transporter-like MFS transporter